MVDGLPETVEQGNTEIVAHIINQCLSTQIVPIEPKDPYPKSFEQTLIRARKEHEQSSLPEYQAVPKDNLAENIWFIGYPDWFGRLPRLVASFLTDNDTSGKLILPFSTHEGSSMGTSQLEIQDLCPQAIVKQGLPVRGCHAASSQRAVQNWLVQYYCGLEQLTTSEERTSLND